MSAFKHFTMMECPRHRVLQQTTEQKPDCSVAMKESEAECIGSTNGNFVNYGASLTTRQATSDPSQWPSDSWMHAGFRYAPGMTAFT